MENWGPYEWVQFICFAVPAVLLTLQQVSDRRRRLARILFRSRLAHIPLILLAIAFISFGGRRVYVWFVSGASGSLQVCGKSQPNDRKIAEWFSKTKDDNRFNLGLQISNCLEQINDASRLSFERSMVLWLGEPRRLFYVIDLENFTWSMIAEGESCAELWCNDDGPKTSSRKAAADHFKKPEPPQNERYPIAGIAEYVTRNPSEWERFGYLRDHCELHGGKIYRLNFEKGFMLGVYPQWSGNSDGQIYTFINEGKSVIASLTGDLKASSCD